MHFQWTYVTNCKGCKLTAFMLLNCVFLQVSALQQDSVEQKPYKNNLLPSPSFTYSPQTDVVLGIYALYQFKMDRYDYDTRPSNAYLYYGSSFFNQNFFTHAHTLLTNKERFFIQGLIEYKVFPEQFYGIGASTDEEKGIIAQYNSMEVRERVSFKLKPSLFLGPQFRYVNTFNVSFSSFKGDSVPAPDVIGNKGGDHAGLGLALLYDKRNSILTPTRDYYLEFSMYYYATALGVESDFMTFDLDGRNYFDLKKNGKKVVALQAKFRFTAGEVPFRELALIGGNQILRGYIKGRFRDQNAFQIQSEYRFNIVGRLGATTFLGMGNVLPKLDNWDFETLKVAIGAGLRFNVNRKDTANVRIDFGWSVVDNNNGLYITFGEAF